MWVGPQLAVLAGGVVVGLAAAAVTGRADTGNPAVMRARFHQAAPDDAPPIGDSLRRLADAIGGVDGPLPSRVASLPAPLHAARRRAAAALARLLQLSRDWPRDTPEPYRRQLARTADIVETSATGADATSLAYLIEPLADDLEIKLGHCEASGGKLGGLIDVRVRTVTGAREAPNWQVLVVPRLLASAPGGAAATPFPRLSSPTAERLVPGRYVLWARHPDHGRASQRQVLVVGGGRSEVDVDLPVPPAP